MSERVTWLLPIKNGMPHLPETLASIEAQTYKNWEVLVWDNGSTDDTLEELKKWIPSRLPGRIITEEPLTLGGSLARMVEECKTEFCARIDADDINLPERLEKQVAFLEVYPEVAVLGSQMYCMDTQGVISDSLYNVPFHHDEIVYAMLIKNSIAHPSVLFRRSAIFKAGNYRHLPEWQGVNIEDYDLWLRVAATNHYKLANLDLPLIRYRIHDKSTTQIAIRENRINKVLDECFCNNAPLLFGCSESEARLLRQKKHFSAIQPLYQIAKHLHKTQGGELINRLRSDSFIQASKSLVSSKDVITRLVLASLEKQPFALPKELFNITNSLALKLPIIGKYFYLLRKLKHNNTWKKQVRQWILVNHKKGTFIDSSISFTLGIRPNLEKLYIEAECYIDKECSLWISEDKEANPKLVIKRNTYIARNTYIGVFQPISIGERVLIGAYSYIISANHCYERRDIPIAEQGFVGAPIVIEDDAWLGTHVVVLPGVSIGKGAIVAACSVVTKDIPAYEVWGGVPAKFIKNRP